MVPFQEFAAQPTTTYTQSVTITNTATVTASSGLSSAQIGGIAGGIIGGLLLIGAAAFIFILRQQKKSVPPTDPQVPAYATEEEKRTSLRYPGESAYGKPSRPY